MNYSVIGERDINYDFDKYDLTKLAKDILDEIGASMQGEPALILEIEGHTDNVPVVHSTQYKNNWGLSQARAKVVTKHLVDKLGVPADAIKETIGVAFYKPVAPNVGKGKAMNRRVDVIIMK